MATATQQARIVGFNAMLKQRGVDVQLDGTDTHFAALLEETGLTGEAFLIDDDGHTGARLHILRSDPNLAQILRDSVLVESDGSQNPGRRYTVRKREQRDIKILLYCTIDEASN